jgi:hypothetical protein
LTAFAAAFALTAVSSPLAKEKTAQAEDSVKSEDDPAKFFLFHLPGVTADQARGDLVFCIGQARPVLSMRDRTGGTGGLLGAMINGRMAEIDRFRMRNAVMRKCMGMMGYDRYAVPQDTWNRIVNEGNIVIDNDGLVDTEVVERMVAFASGPAPVFEKVDP